MVIKHGRFGKFIACSGYPECKTTKPVTSASRALSRLRWQLVERRSKRGKTFYACNKYPECKFVAWRARSPSPARSAERVPHGARGQGRQADAPVHPRRVRLREEVAPRWREPPS
jgi:DNA topoisomerase-1